VLNAIPNTGGSVSASNLAASGTGSSSNFLRGDMAWTSATGTGSVALASLPTFTTTIGVGGATASASGSGISFPATQSASSDANTLDDYEEGTWTPSLGGTTTYVSQIGAYTKIGRFVLATFEVHVSSIGTGSTLSIAGLPFTSFSTPTNGMGGMVGYYSNAANSIYFLTLRLDLSSTTIGLATVTTAGATLNTGSAFFQNGTRVLGSICYMTA
jgi:hypothetical protein